MLCYLFRFPSQLKRAKTFHCHNFLSMTKESFTFLSIQANKMLLDGSEKLLSHQRMEEEEGRKKVSSIKID